MTHPRQGDEWACNANQTLMSVLPDHSSVSKESHVAPCISFKELRDRSKGISVIKMDIEGSEYECLKECIGIKQVCVEFHHFCLADKTFSDTQVAIDMMIENGYEILAVRSQETEFTFIKR